MRIALKNKKQNKIKKILPWILWMFLAGSISLNIWSQKDMFITFYDTIIRDI